MPWENYTTFKFGSSAESLNVWIDEPGQGNTDGLQQPSSEMAKLNFHFYRRSQLPVLEPILDYPFAVDVMTSNYSEEFGFWRVEVQKIGDEVVKGYRVKGRPVSFGHCTVADMNVLTPGPDIEVSTNHTDCPSLKPVDSSFTMFRDKKYANTFVFMAGGNISVTINAFGSWRNFDLKANQEDQVKSLSFTEKSLVVLTSGGRIFFGNFTRSFKYPAIVQLTDFGMSDNVLGIDGSKETPTKIGKNDIGTSKWLHWTNDELHLCEFEICNDVEIPAEDFVNAGVLAKSNVVTALYNGMFRGDLAAILACLNQANERKLVFARYEALGQLWNVTSIDLTYEASMPYKITFMKHQIFYVIWSPLQMFYISNEVATEVHILENGDQREISEVLDLSHKISNVVAYNGKVVVQTSDNLLFYGHVTVDYIFQLPPWLGKTGETNIWFDEIGRLHLTTFQASQNIVDEIYPLEIEVRSVLIASQHPACPFTYFRSLNSVQSVSIDRNDEMIIGGRLSALDLGADIQFSTTSQQFISSVGSSAMNRTSRKIVEKSAVISFNGGSYIGNTSKEDYEDFLERSSGYAVLSYSPSNASLFCKDPQLLTVAVHGGCPSNRYISIKRDPGGCQHFDQFTVFSNSLNGTLNGSLIYNWERWGCPVMVHAEDDYKPHLVLMDGDKEIRTIKENFVIYEVFGQTVQYTATETQVHCVKPAQNWQKMTENFLASKGSSNITQNTEKEKIWGPWNYESCFKSSGFSSANPSDVVSDFPYEVLNCTGLSSVTFKKTENHVYVFRATVVDRTSSYCLLQTEFAVQTFGAYSQAKVGVTSVVTIGVFLIICVAFFVGLYWSYTEHYYSKLFIKDEEPNEE